MAKIEQAKAHHAELKAKGEYEATVSYKPVRAGINAFNKKLTTVTNYRISEFYKASKVRQALASVKLAMHYYKHPAEVTQLDANTATVNRADSELIDNEAIKSQLLKHLPAVKHHLESLASDYLAVTEWHKIPADNDKAIEPLKAYFEALPNGGFKLKSGKQKELLDALAKLPKHTSTSLMLTEQADAELLLPSGIVAVQKLTEQIGIEPVGEVMAYLNSNPATGRHNTVIGGDGTQYKDNADVITTAIHISHKIALEYLVATLARMREQADKKGHYTPPNIRDDTSVNYVPKPPIEAINETLIKLASEPEAEATITKMYANERERQQKNGLPITIDRFEQQALFDDIKVRGVRDINKILDITTSLTIPAFYMLSGHLQELQRESGKHIEELVIPEMSITEFMRINPRFNTAKARKKGIGKEHREAAINSLDLLRRVQYPINRPIKKDGKTVGYELDSVKVYDYTLITDADKNITSIRNLQYSRDFLAKYNRILAVPYGEGFYTLTEITHQQLDITIQTMFTSKANIKRTTAGEPLIVDAKEFKKIYKDYSLSHFYRTLANGLNKLTEINEISRWHTAAGGQEITSREPSSQTLYIYPAAIHEALITSDERKVKQMEQRRRLRDLKSLITQYRKDLRQNKTSSTEYLKYLADDLAITQAELNGILAGDEPINDELWHKINELCSDL
ncbi:MAG: hypothetical protein EOL90_11475 [Spartobacteria bacterium]|nr:hypothetical protein [Spartobacteria bacterium]